MGKFTEQQLRSLWQSGVDLSASWYKYAAPDLQARWKASNELSAMEAFSTAIPRAREAATSGVDALIKAIVAPQSILNERMQARSQMEANIIGYIRNGYAFAYGFEPPRRSASTPLALPLETWSGQIDWERNRVTYRGLVYEQVRITSRGAYDNVLGRSIKADTPPAPKIGRPGIGQQIQTVCREMIDRGMIDPMLSAKSHFPIIRNQLNRQFPDQMATFGDLSDETLRRQFAPVFNELKKSKKQ